MAGDIPKIWYLYGKNKNKGSQQLKSNWNINDKPTIEIIIIKIKSTFYNGRWYAWGMVPIIKQIKIKEADS